MEFSDFECPYCSGLFPTLRRVEETYKDKIRIVYRQFPLNNIHPHAQKAAEASLCANDQDKFWQLHDAMFADQQNLTIEDLKSKAASLSLNATTFSSCLDSGKHAAIIRDSIAEGSINLVLMERRHCSSTAAFSAAISLTTRSQKSSKTSWRAPASKAGGLS